VVEKWALACLGSASGGEGPWGLPAADRGFFVPLQSNRFRIPEPQQQALVDFIDKHPTLKDSNLRVKENGIVRGTKQRKIVGTDKQTGEEIKYVSLATLVHR
jgi:hypothetical protein